MGDDELIKYGRLNLVDLAGSENISRSGSREVWINFIIFFTIKPIFRNEDLRYEVNNYPN